MFVSSYSTYINTNNSDKTTKAKPQEVASNTSYTPEVDEKPKAKLATTSLPIDYVSQGKTYNNKLEAELQQLQLQNPDDKDLTKTKKSTQEFSSHNTLQNAKQAYTDNSKTYSYFRQPQPTQDQTPRIDKRAPTEIQEIKEQNLRNTMVNTYTQNEKYYQLTA